MMETLLGNRKLFFMGGLTLVILMAGAAMAIWGDLSSEQFIELAKWIGGLAMGSFAVGNGLEHLGSGKQAPK